MAYGPWSASSMTVCLGSDWIQTRRGIRKAQVFPEPVSATPMMSLLVSPMGMACLWMGVGSL